jgi:hypothetical protein
MALFSGNTSTSATSTPLSIEYKIKSIRLINKSGGAIIVNASLLYGSTNIWITPYNKSLAAGEVYIYDPCEIDLIPDASIYLSVNGSCDYFFVLE